MAGTKITRCCLIGALAAAGILGVDAWTLRGTLHATQDALAESAANEAIMRRGAEICRGMILHQESHIPQFPL